MPDNKEEKHGLLLEAAAFAARAHRGHIRKDGETPYVSHVFRVCLVLRHVFGIDDEQALITALLHDTVEDTNTDFDDLEEKFGREVAEWVSFLSKDKRLPEKSREQDYMRQLAAAPWQVRACKLADMFDNLMDSSHFAAEKRATVRKHVSAYFECLKNVPHERLQRPLELVGDLLQQD